MFVTIEPKRDIVVCETHVTEQYTQDIKIVWSEDDEQYHVVWARTGGYQLMWRGNLEGCMREFRGIVGDTFADSLTKEGLSA
jgi:hypothetical protein